MLNRSANLNTDEQMNGSHPFMATPYHDQAFEETHS